MERWYLNTDYHNDNSNNEDYIRLLRVRHAETGEAACNVNAILAFSSTLLSGPRDTYVSFVRKYHFLRQQLLRLSERKRRPLSYFEVFNLIDVSYMWGLSRMTLFSVLLLLLLLLFSVFKI